MSSTRERRELNDESLSSASPVMTCPILCKEASHFIKKATPRWAAEAEITSGEKGGYRSEARYRTYIFTSTESMYQYLHHLWVSDIDIVLRRGPLRPIDRNTLLVGTGDSKENDEGNTLALILYQKWKFLSSFFYKFAPNVLNGNLGYQGPQQAELVAQVANFRQERGNDSSTLNGLHKSDDFLK